MDEQIFAWHKEAAGYKIRHVPAALLVCAARASVVPDPGFRMPVRPSVSAGMAAATMLVALTITHGLVGWLRYRDGWAGFFQPFAGGAHYVLCQILAWTLASVCLCALAAGATTARPHSALMLAAATGLLSEVALAASLVYYTPTHRGELPKPGGARARPQLGLGAALARATRVAIAWSAVCALYSSPYAAMFIFIGPLLVLPPSTSLPLVAVMAATYFPAVLLSTAPSTGRQASRPASVSARASSAPARSAILMPPSACDRRRNATNPRSSVWSRAFRSAVSFMSMLRPPGA